MKFQEKCILGVLLFTMPFIFSCKNKKDTLSEQTKEEKVQTQEGEVIATVNGTPIYQKELERAFNHHSGQNKDMTAKMPDEQIKKLRQMILNQLIETTLLYQKGEEMNIKPNDDEINGRLQQILKQYPSQEEFMQTLGKNGLTQEDLISDLKKNYVISKVIQGHMQSAKEEKAFTEKELKDYYNAHKEEYKEEEKVQASHILIKVDKGADEKIHEETKEKITKILQEAKKGKDFGELAKENSDCPSSAKGGDLGFFSKGRMVPEFSKVAFNLKEGEISDIVKTQFGYHIIKVTGHKPAKEKSFEESKRKIKQKLAGKNKGNNIKDYIRTLREQADIKILLPELAEETN